MTDDNDLIRRGDVMAVLSAASRTAQKTIDAIATLQRHQVTVKTLEWAQVGDGSFVAHTAFGDYVVELHDQWGMWTPREDDFTLEAHSWHMTEDGAKAEAQTNFNTHTLASIEPAPVTLADALQVPEVQALVVAARKTILAAEMREAYHRLPNDRNRIGDPKSKKSKARDAWLKAFRRAALSAEIALRAIKEGEV